MIHEDIVLELVCIERRAHARLRQRAAEQQLGLAWEGIETAPGSGITWTGRTLKSAEA